MKKFFNKNVKTVLALMLTVVMLFSLAACGSENVSSSNDLTNSQSNNSFNNTTSLVFIDDDDREVESDVIVSGGTSGTSSTVLPQQGTTSVNSNGSVGTGTAKPVTPSGIPAYSGSPYVVINNNVPNFSKAELTTKGYEKYSELDSLGRCGVAVASLGKETMPKAGEERGDIGSITPSGWKNESYPKSLVPTGWLYNRSHLIGWQLSAENDNEKNLITGTQFFNQKGMKPFEDMVADYIKETGNHVAYRVTPIYIGNNLLASGVQMEAYSVEDNGKGICFNVYCYNVQDGIVINYATGANSAKDSSLVSSKPSNEDGKITYVLNTKTLKFHLETCSSAAKISASNKSTSNASRQSLIDQGYSPCGICKP